MGYQSNRRADHAFRIAETALQLSDAHRAQLRLLLDAIDAGETPSAELLAECRQSLTHELPADQRALVQRYAKGRTE